MGNKKLKMVCAVLLCSLFLSVQPTAVYAGSNSIRFLIDGQEWDSSVYVETPLYDETGRLEVPLAYLSAWGYPVKLEDDALISRIYKGPEKESYITMPFHMEHGVPYVPVRTVLNALDDKVNWDRQNNRVEIEKGGLSGQIQIHFIDVGEGDSSLIDVGDFEVLIDAGPNSAGQSVVDYIRPYVDGSLDLVIATHVHHDHIGGMDDVLNAYRVNEIIHCGDTYDTQSYKDYYEAAMKQPDCKYIKDEDMTIDLGHGAVLRIMDIMDESENLNDNSVIAQLEYGEVKVLFTGDMEQAEELKGLELNRFEKVDVLKVCHHGSSTSSTDGFLQVVKPQVGVISAGYGALPKHPHVRALKRLLAADIKLYGTFKSGTVVMTTDGKTYSFNTDQELTLKDAGIYHFPSAV